MKGFRYFILYKPYGYLSQFSRELPEHRTLADLYQFSKDVYPVGRLDRDSEGLLILTNDKSLNARLLHPARGHRRTYWVQLEGNPDAASLERLAAGVDIRIKKKTYRTAPATVRLLAIPPDLPERDPPIRYRAQIPTTWLELQLTEGKNRQVRRMCAAVGFPVLRLVRVAIESLTLNGLTPGEVREVERDWLFDVLMQ